MGTRLPNSLGLDKLSVQSAKDNVTRSILDKLFNRLELIYKLFYGDFDSLNDKIDQGVSSGWFDDGTNFRVTVTNGIITAIEDSTAGGHS